MGICKLKVLGSSSHGNCYIIECSEDILILELGVKWGEIMQELNYGEGLKRVRGCLTSHRRRHQDHSLSIPNAIKYAVDVYSCADVQTIHPKVKVLSKGVKTQIGGFKVQPVDMFHSVECYGFLIEHQECGRIVFCTDTSKIPYRFKNIQHFIVEANYDADIVLNCLLSNVLNSSQSENHMEIDDTIDFLKNNVNENTNSITLVHLSNGNSNEKEFRERVRNELGFSNVYVADKGMTIDLSLDAI